MSEAPKDPVSTSIKKIEFIEQGKYRAEVSIDTSKIKNLNLSIEVKAPDYGRVSYAVYSLLFEFAKELYSHSDAHLQPRR